MNILQYLRESYPLGFCYKDLTGVFELNAGWMVSCPEPVLLKINMADLSAIVEHLIGEGISPSQPCAFLSGFDTEVAVPGTLGDIVLRTRKVKDLVAYILLAETITLPHKNARTGRLAGKNILVTRARKQSSTLREALERENARVFEVPTIQIEVLKESFRDLQTAFESIDRYSWVLLTSANTVSILSDLLGGWNISWQTWPGTRIACIGKATEEKVREAGGKVDLVPPLFQAESLAEELVKAGVNGQRILLPRAKGSRPILPEILRSHGAEVDEIFVYEARVPESSRQQLLETLKNQKLQFITFTSSSTVRNFVEIAGDILPDLSKQGIRIACIGPITAETLQEFGVAPDIVAEEFSIPGLVQAIVDYVS